jgi:hypothetical protein
MDFFVPAIADAFSELKLNNKVVIAEGSHGDYWLYISKIIADVLNKGQCKYYYVESFNRVEIELYNNSFFGLF